MTAFHSSLNDDGNNVYTFELTDGTASDCPTADPATLTKSGHDISDDFPYALGSLKDFQVRVHLKSNCRDHIASRSVTFTGTLTNYRLSYLLYPEHFGHRIYQSTT